MCECYGATIHHCPYCDGWEHRNERILVFAKETDKSVELAVELKGWSRQVTVLTNGGVLTEDQIRRLSENEIAYAQQKIVQFMHDQGQLAGVELEGRGRLPADAMFFHTHQRPGCDLPCSVGVERDDIFSGHTGRKQQTNISGLFIAGDADGDVQFAIVAAAEGATAAVAINSQLLKEDADMRQKA